MPNRTNTLATTSSAYLRAAMNQPIHWQEWGQDAFTRAADGNKPVLLDIGAVWCRGCRAMDREFESAEIAAIVNQHYIAVKVDRDERPEVDARYQAAVAAIGEPGGWPLTVFLTPDGKPLYGTCFPSPEANRQTRFRNILLTIAKTLQMRRDELEQESDKLLNLLSHTESQRGNSARFMASNVDEIVQSGLNLFDHKKGGIGPASQFPPPAMLDLLVDWYARTGEEQAGAVITTTLEKMARSDIYDHIGGGFHRYSPKERGSVPSSEKMACDNSELLKTYVHAWQATGNAFFLEVAQNILRWMDTSLSDRERGGFFASQADDHIDRTVYTGWNALCISSYLLAARALSASGDTTAPQVQQFALRSLDRLLTESWKDEQLDHVVIYANGNSGRGGPPGLLDDYAFTVLACLDAYEATTDLRYFEQARAIVIQMFKYFYDGMFGGFTDIRLACSPLGALRALRKPFRDAPTPAGNPAAAIALLRIFAFTNDDVYQHRAKQTLEVVAGAVGQFGAEAGTYGVASVWLARPHTQVVVVGEGAEADELYAAALRPFALTKAVLRIPYGAWDSLPPALGETLATLPGVSAERPLALVCTGFTCHPPVTSAAELTTLLREVLSQR